MSFHSPIPHDAALLAPALSQSRLYQQILSALDRRTLRLTLGDCGVARLIVRDLGPFGHIALIPGGPLWQQGASLTDRRAAVRALPRLLHRHRIRALITNSTSPLEARLLTAAGHLPIMSGGHTARLDLGASEDARRARMNGKWRNRLAKAESCGLQTHRSRFTPGRHDWLLTGEAAQRKSRGYRGLPLGFAAVASRLAPDQVQLFTAMHKGARVAAMLFLIHEGAASYHIGQISDQGRALGAHNLLLWRASRWLAAQGCGWIDLGPVDTETNPGLARFKLGSGAAPVPRGATCLYTSPTAPIGRWAAALRRKAVRGPATRSGPSCR